MKKIILIIVMFLFIPNIRALGIVREEKIDGVYANQIVNGVGYSAKFTYIYINNEVSYCIEPGVMLNSSNYHETTDFNNYNVTAEDKYYLELVSYYGYNYPNHQNKYYYMATQELIWRRITSDHVAFTTGPWFSGDTINIEPYKKEILELINKHNVKPSFDGTILTEKDNIITISDKNSVLNKFKVVTGNAYIQNNQLIINGRNNIKLEQNYTGTSYIYNSPGSQRLINLKLNDKITSTLTINPKIDDYDLKIVKKDKDTNEIIGEALFKIKKLIDDSYVKINNNDLLETINGVLYLDNLEEGYYLIEEIEAPEGYMINKEPITVVVNKNNIEQVIYNKKLIMPKTGYQINKNAILLSFILSFSLHRIKRHVK